MNPKPTKGRNSTLAAHLNVDEQKLDRIIDTDYGQLADDLSNAQFVITNIRDVLSALSITHQALADHLELAKDKMYRRFDKPDLWELGNLRKVMHFIHANRKIKNEHDKKRKQISRVSGNTST